MTSSLGLVKIALQFRTTSVINKLPFYHGAHWYALIHNVFDRVNGADDYDDFPLCVHPTDTGLLSYKQDERVNIGLSFPVEYLGHVNRMLSVFNEVQADEGHFQPKETIILEGTSKLIDNEMSVLNEHVIADEIAYLMMNREFNLHLYAPMRLKRPDSAKKEGHRYYDAMLFTENMDDDMLLSHFLKSIRYDDGTPIDVNRLKITDADVMWVDFAYGKGRKKKTFGGIVGNIRLKGNIDENTARMLVLGQYYGVGKNSSYGLGFYNIPVIDHVKKIERPARHISLLERFVNVRSLRSAVRSIERSTTNDNEGMMIDKMLSMNTSQLEDLVRRVLTDSHQVEEPVKFQIPKPDGTHREIVKLSLNDRILQKAVAEELDPIVEEFLTISAIAYRKGISINRTILNIQKSMSDGFLYGIKADIDACFDSVDIKKLEHLLRGILPLDPIVDRIIDWIKSVNRYSHNTGLPQGSPLSPLLSNLYLSIFDKEIEKTPFRLFRYSDDFIMLSEKEHRLEDMISIIDKALAPIGLSINEDKTKTIKKDNMVEFVGYNISSHDVEKKTVQS